MKVETWGQLMQLVKQRDILAACKGKLTQRQVHAWAHSGLPHFEHQGRSDRHRWIVKAAQDKGLKITLDEVLKLSAEHKKVSA